MGGFAREVGVAIQLKQMKNILFYISLILVLISCKKEKQNNPDLSITNTHWYQLSEDGADTLFYVNVPNAFTPNGDGTNDSFYPRIRYGQLNRLRIFSKSNQLISEGADLNYKWDGMVNNGSDAVPVGVYNYKLEVIDRHGSIHNNNGFVIVNKLLNKSQRFYFAILFLFKLDKTTNSYLVCSSGC